MKHPSMSESIVTWYVQAEYCWRTLVEKTQRHSGMFLCTIGCVLILGGSLKIVESQTDPEPAHAQDPEGVCCVAIPEQVFVVLNPQQLATADPQGSVTADPQAALVDGTPIAAIPGALPEPLEANYDDTLNRYAAGNLLWFIEGAFGALIMIGAGLGAIIAGAFGAYKAAISLLFVAVGAFILRALVSLFFGTDYDAYTAGGVGQFVGDGL
jgi:hypothetical protein